jgi:predicted DNA-binding protein with PD1-like motif
MTRPLRRLIQPGPPHPERFDSHGTTLRTLCFTLQPGLTLNEAAAAPLVAAGWQSATLRFAGGRLAPLRYVIPAPADDASHVAYFSAPRSAAGETRIEEACATFGWSGSAPFLHCHAVWIDPDGRRAGGHILPQESLVATPIEVEAWGSADIRIAAAQDPETNFRLLQPMGPRALAGNGVIARIKPNEDITLAVEAVARRHSLRDATIRGTLGSLVGASFTDGRVVEDHATEVLLRESRLTDGVAVLDLLVVDMQGMVHGGILARGENAVCITADLVLEAA